LAANQPDCDSRVTNAFPGCTFQKKDLSQSCHDGVAASLAAVFILPFDSNGFHIDHQI
jgi:hypothetical protein